jgi:phosphoenolpyruvate carboxykinase (ATP)
LATTAERVDLRRHGIAPAGTVFRNPTTPVLYEHALERGEARIGEGGPFVVDTGLHTGRSAKDKFAVREPGSENRIWWGPVNNELSPDEFEGLREKVADYLGKRRVTAPTERMWRLCRRVRLLLRT